MSKTIILIPSRLSAKRLPGKPLLKINGKSLVYNVYKKALDCKIGKVYVATGDKKIFNNITKSGGNCILTKKQHKSGTDRIYEALQKIKLKGIKYVLNIQGDEPLVSIKDVIKLNNTVIKNKLKFSTLGCNISNKKIYNDKNIVKVEVSKKINNYFEAKSFFRNNKAKKNNKIYHHIGIYQYNLDTLKKFTYLKQTRNEKKFKLEQLRALDNKIGINVILAKYTPIGIDTYSDYLKVKKIMERNN